ncbi:MAG: hypothetical protein AAF432_04470 [Planctomycetota bacterium]
MNTTSTDPNQSSASEAFYREYLAVAQALRHALINAFDAVGVNPSTPREASRRLGLDKNLTWKLSRIVNAEAMSRVAESVPGTSGIQLVCRAFRKLQPSDACIDVLESAFQRFENLVTQHSSSRETLQFMLDGLDTPQPERLEQVRRLAYRGNCGIWGVQARVRLSAHVMALDEDATQIRYAQFGGLIGFQRLRPGPRWPLFSFHTYNDDGTPVHPHMVPIEASSRPDFPLLITSLCTGTLPDMFMSVEERTTSYEYGDGPVGTSGECDAYFGYLDTTTRTRYRDEHNQLGELLCVINTPIETLVFDLIVQRELAEQISPEALMYGRATGMPYGHERRDDRTLIPIGDSLRELEPGPHLLTSPLVRGSNTLGTRVLDMMDRSIDDFIGWRLVMPYPVMPSTVSVRFELPDR